MKTGRPPKPTHLKLIEGNPGKRRLNAHEPMPDHVLPDPPEFLTVDAGIEWMRLSEELFRLGLLTGIDRGALAAVCQAYGRWQRAERALAEMAKSDRATGALLVKSGKGAMENPLVGTARRAMSDYVRFCSEFGMTPSARSRVEAGAMAMPKSKFDGLLGGKA